MHTGHPSNQRPAWFKSGIFLRIGNWIGKQPKSVHLRSVQIGGGREKAGLVQGVRTSGQAIKSGLGRTRKNILWLLVTAITVSAWLPILADQVLPGVTTTAKADIPIPDFVLNQNMTAVSQEINGINGTVYFANPDTVASSYVGGTTQLTDRGYSTFIPRNFQAAGFAKTDLGTRLDFTWDQPTSTDPSVIFQSIGGTVASVLNFYGPCTFNRYVIGYIGVSNNNPVGSGNVTPGTSSSDPSVDKTSITPVVTEGLSDSAFITMDKQRSINNIYGINTAQQAATYNFRLYAVYSCPNVVYGNFVSFKNIQLAFQGPTIPVALGPITKDATTGKDVAGSVIGDPNKGLDTNSENSAGDTGNGKCGTPPGNNPYSGVSAWATNPTNVIYWGTCAAWNLTVSIVTWLYTNTIPWIMTPVVCSTRLAEYLTPPATTTSTSNATPPSQGKNSNSSIQCDAVTSVFGTGMWGSTIFHIALNLVNYVIVLVLLFLSFVNILHINIDTYGIKKVMPTLIVGVILGQFGLLISRIIADVGDVLLFALAQPADIANGISHTMTTLLGIATTGASITTLLTIGTGGTLIPVAILIFVIVLLAPYLFFGALGLLMWARFYVVMLLAALSPLAFVAMALPVTQSYFKQWYDNMLKWVFMAPISFFFLALIAPITKSITLSPSSSFITVIQEVLVVGGLMYAAIQVPFSLGGAVMNNWGGFLKKAGTFAGKTGDQWFGQLTGKTNISGFITGFKQRSQTREQELLAKTSAGGAATSEMLSRSPGALWKLVKSGGKAGGLQDIKNAFSEEMVRSQSAITAEIKKRAETVVSGNTGMGEDDIKAAFAAAMANQDYEGARDMLLLAANRGIVDKKMQADFMEKFSSNREAASINTLIPEMQNQQAQSPEELLTSTHKLVDGKLVEKGVGEMNKELDRATDKFASSHNRGAVQTFTRKIVEKYQLVDEHGNLKDPSTMSADQRAWFDRLRRIEPTSLDDRIRPAIQSVNPDVRFGVDTFSGISNATERNAVQSAIQEAMSSHGIVQSNPQAERALANQLRSNMAHIQAGLDAHKLELYRDLDPEIYQAGIGAKTMDEWKGRLSPQQIESLRSNGSWQQLHRIEKGAQEIHRVAQKADANASTNPNLLEHFQLGGDFVRTQPERPTPTPPPTPRPRGLIPGRNQPPTT